MRTCYFSAFGIIGLEVTYNTPTGDSPVVKAHGYFDAPATCTAVDVDYANGATFTTIRLDHETNRLNQMLIQDSDGNNSAAGAAGSND